MNKTDTNLANDDAGQGALLDEGTTSMPMHRRDRIEFRPNSFSDRGNDDDSWLDPMIGNRFLERRKPFLY